MYKMRASDLPQLVATSYYNLLMPLALVVLNYLL